MECHRVTGISNRVNPLALGKIGVQIDDALIDIKKVAVDLRRAVRRARARSPGASRDINDGHELVRVWSRRRISTFGFSSTGV